MIYGVTNIRIFSIRYLVVDPTYPYHLNTFSDVEANYSTTGGIVNISGGSCARTYINNVNYT